MSQHNPWLTAATPPPAGPVSPTTGPATGPGTGPTAGSAAGPVTGPVTGPVRPQRGVQELESVDRLPRRTVQVPAPLWWLGAHGGAGESTLADYLPGSRAAAHTWPVGAHPGAPSPVVLVCRSHARGLHAAQLALTDWASGAVDGVEVLGLVVVADAPGRLPKPLRDLAHLVGGGAPRVWQLPWLEAARYGPTDGTTAAPASARTLLRDLAALTDPTTAPAPVPTREVSR